jgi:hypothetical protein
LKIGARVIVSVRRIKTLMTSAFPYQALVVLARTRLTDLSRAYKLRNAAHGPPMVARRDPSWLPNAPLHRTSETSTNRS